MSNFCSKCGQSLSDSKFCPNCGEPVQNNNTEFVSSAYRDPSQRIQEAKDKTSSFDKSV